MDTGTLKDLLNSGKTPEEINAILSGSTVSSGTLDPNFMAGEPYMPPQQMPMPQNYIRNERTGATYDMGQSQPSGPALDYSSPIEIGGQGKGYRLKGDASRVMLQDGRMFDLGRDTGAERARILEDMKIAKARQELEQGGVESQLKRAQLEQLTNPKKAAGFSSMKEIFDAENKLADDHKAQAKTFIDVRDAYSRLDSAMDKATTSAPSALAGATVFMKLLDPGSVVRESELGMALAATGAIDRMENYYNTLKNGKVLTESQAKEFKLVGKQLYEAAKTNQTQLDQHYTGRAKAYGLDPSKVVGDYYLKEKPASAPTTTPAPALSPAEQQELAQLRARFKK